MAMCILIGFLFGYLGSMPVAGPLAVLVLRLGLDHDGRHGWYLAAGGALAEGLYAMLAFLGLGAFLDRHPTILPASRLAGAAICLVLGIVLLVHRPRPASRAPAPGPARGHKRSFAGGFLLTALNPTFLVTWTAALTALHASGLVRLSPDRAAPFAGAVALGVLAWFSTLLGLLGRYRERFNPAAVTVLIRTMGAVLVAMALWIGGRALARPRPFVQSHFSGEIPWPC